MNSSSPSASLRDSLRSRCVSANWLIRVTSCSRPTDTPGVAWFIDFNRTSLDQLSQVKQIGKTPAQDILNQISADTTHSPAIYK